MNNAGRLILGLVVIVLLGLGIWYWAPSSSNAPSPTPPAPTAGLEEFNDADLGISFRYPDRYTVDRRDQSTAQRKRETIVLTRIEDLPPPENGEGPPTITIEAFQNNIDTYTLDRFIRDTSFTNFKLSPDNAIASTTVGGVPAASFRWSGLYEGRSLVVARDEWVYVFSVTYLTPQDEIIADFDDIIDTVEFEA